jgi:predicted GNAT family acetyltransferase
MAYTLERPTHVAGFLALARELLAAREAENNLIFGLCDVIASHPEVYPECRFAVGIDGGTPVGAALQTPPHNLILSTMDPDDARRLAVALGPEAEALPGVLGPTDVVRGFVDATGRRSTVAMRERIFRADRVIAPRRAPGSWRLADERDRATLAAWADAFRAEALPGQPNREDGAATADRWLRRAGRTIYVWDDAAGAPVSIAGAGGLTPLGVRIGPVYTPPARRGRGFASNLVAAVTQQQLSEGRAFCFLFTDLSNPTSNKIYQAVGYAPVIDVDQYAFS